MNEIGISDIDGFADDFARVLTATLVAARGEIDAARATGGDAAAAAVVRRVLTEKIDTVFADAMREFEQELAAGAPERQ